MATKDERKYLSSVADIGCILCKHLGYSDTPAEIHHIRRFGGKRDNAPVIPLCPEHHRGNTGVHGLGHKGFDRRYGITELELFDEAQRILQEKAERSKLVRVGDDRRSGPEE
jgi:hypothetical protein